MPLLYFQEAIEIVNMVGNLMKENANTKALLPIQRIRRREIQLPDSMLRINFLKNVILNLCSLLILMSF